MAPAAREGPRQRCVFAPQRFTFVQSDLFLSAWPYFYGQSIWVLSPCPTTVISSTVLFALRLFLGTNPALLQYKPSDSRYARALGRFPKRNRFISDFIYEETGVRRTPKQVGSRLQQLKDVGCGKQRESTQLALRFYRSRPSLSNPVRGRSAEQSDLFPPLFCTKMIDAWTPTVLNHVASWSLAAASNGASGSSSTDVNNLNISIHNAGNGTSRPSLYPLLRRSYYTCSRHVLVPPPFDPRPSMMPTPPCKMSQNAKHKNMTQLASV